VTKLSANVNKLALLRNSRQQNNPNLLWWGERILNWGSHGLTVHPRPDGRHIRYSDVVVLAELIRSRNQAGGSAELNVEGFPSDEYLSLIRQTRPHQCTLVPDPPEALTSNAGWDFVKNKPWLTTTVSQLKDLGCRVSLFLEPAKFTEEQAEALAGIPCDRVELYTESYAHAHEQGPLSPTLEQYIEAAAQATALGLGLNAGHDLNQSNLRTLLDAIPGIQEVSIGHALVCEALLVGVETTIRHYLRILGTTS
jgi:pyridoxine 5-phosphate synthase